MNRKGRLRRPFGRGSRRDYREQVLLIKIRSGNGPHFRKTSGAIHVINAELIPLPHSLQTLNRSTPPASRRSLNVLPNTCPPGIILCLDSRVIGNKILSCNALGVSLVPLGIIRVVLHRPVMTLLKNAASLRKRGRASNNHLTTHGKRNFGMPGSHTLHGQILRVSRSNDADCRIGNLILPETRSPGSTHIMRHDELKPLITIILVAPQAHASGLLLK